MGNNNASQSLHALNFWGMEWTSQCSYISCHVVTCLGQCWLMHLYFACFEFKRITGWVCDVQGETSQEDKAKMQCHESSVIVATYIH